MILNCSANGFTFEFVSVSGESRATLDANTFHDPWSSSLTVAVVAAETLDMNQLLFTLQHLLKSGFNGWIIASEDRPPHSLTSFRIHSPAETEGVKNALLVCTIGFKAAMPAELR